MQSSDPRISNFYKYMCFHFKRAGRGEAILVKAGPREEMVVILEKQQGTHEL